VEAVFIPCTAVRTLEAIEPLEQRIGKPVITAIQATMWAVQRLAGVAADVAGGGRLFEVALAATGEGVFTMNAIDTGPDLSVVPSAWSRITNLVVDRGEGSWLITTDGRRYLDYSSGIGVTSTGHAHPRVVAAIQEQAAKLLHGQQNIVYHEPGLRLYDRLQHVLPGDGWGAFPVELGRGGGRGVGQAGAHRRPVGRSSLRSAMASTAGQARPWR
jgi:hypothetical protein